MNTKLYLLISLILIITEVNCTKNQKNDNPDKLKVSTNGKLDNEQDNYQPLKVGYKWDYNVEIGLEDSPSEIKGSISLEIVKEESINNAKYFKVMNLISGISGYNTDVNYYRKSDKGIIYLNSKNEEDITIPSVLTIGSEWNLVTKLWKKEFDESSESFVVRRKILGFEDVMTKSGIFKNCLKIESKGKYKLGKITCIEYYSIGIGLIKEIMKLETQLGNQITELELSKINF